MRTLKPSRLAVVATLAATALALPSGVVSAAFAAEPPDPTPGSVFFDDFSSGVDGWTAITGDLASWTMSDDTHPVLSVDTQGEAAGLYIRPDEDLELPDMYELTAVLRVDAVNASSTVSLLFDMSDPDNVKGTDMAVQFGAFDTNGNASVKVVSPLGVTRVCDGVSPVRADTWHVVKVQRAGGITSIWVDGELVASAASVASGGTLALGSFKSAFSVGSISVNELTSVPADQPTTAAGCTWIPEVPDPDDDIDPGTGTGTVSGDGEWVAASAPAIDAPGHLVSAGQSTISLNGEWQFTTDPGGQGEARDYPEPATDTSGWDTLTVPGSWDTHDRYGTYQGLAWYKKTFQTGDLDADAHEHAILHFDAVYWNTTVWVNGLRVGSHVDGYTPFEFDISTYLVDGENTIVLSVDNSYERPAWWPWGGISRDVTLIRTGDVVVDHQEVVTTPDLAAGTATVTSTVTLRNRGEADVTTTVSGRIAEVDLGGTLADAGSPSVTVPAGGTAQVELTASLAAGTFTLWGLDTPQLYRFEVAVDGGETLSDRFGIRSVVIDGTAILLNGEQVRLAGANRVADDPVDANTEPTALVRRDLDRMKAAGMNMQRIIHFPQAPELLDYADEIGMLLIVESLMRGVQTDAPTSLIGEIPRVQAEMRESIPRDFNHPSIFAYSVGNEIASDTPSGITYDQTLSEYARALDPTRYVTQASSRIDSVSRPELDGSQFMDFVSINLYGNFAGAVDHVHSLYPDVPVFVSEYSPDGYTFGINRQTLDFDTGVATSANAFRSRPFVAGWSQWAFKDYRSDFTGSSPDLIRGWGDLDAWGRLKKAYTTAQLGNSPVKSLELTGIVRSDDRAVAVATVTPRGAVGTDGPGYVLSGYSLVLRVTDADGSVVGGTMLPLPDIAPGDAPVTVPVSWQGADDGTTARLTLLSPTGFEVTVTTVALATPAAPEIAEVVPSSTGVRVRLTDPADTRSYRVQALDADGRAVATVTTREQYADLGGLTADTDYTVRVAAVNAAGTSPFDTATTRTTGTLPAAPRLAALVPVVGGLVLGFSDNTANAAFEVSVVDAATSDEVRHYTTKNRPDTRIEELTPGRAYDVSIRRLAGDGSPATVWSEPLRGTPLGSSSAPALVVDGLVTGADVAGVVIRPQDGAERYRIELDGPGASRSYTIERSAIELLPITGLAPSSDYEISVAAESATGVSDAWHGEFRTTASASAGVDAPTGVGYENRGDDVYLTWDAPETEVDGYLVSRTGCGQTTTTLVSGTGLKVGELATSGGDYTVTAVRTGVSSPASAVVSIPGDVLCQWVITPTDTSPRADGSVPFSTSSSWQASAVLGAGGHPSVYASASLVPSPTATWTAPEADEVTLRVEVSLPDAASVTTAHYTIHTADGDVDVVVDQDAHRNAWVDLGEYDFTSAKPGSVTLSSGTGGTYLRASAVRFTMIADAPEVTAPTPGMADQRVQLGDPVTGTGSGVGDAITVTTAEGTVVGTTTVTEGLDWSLVPSLGVGFWPVTVTEKDAAGWTGTASADVTVVPVDAPALEVTLSQDELRAGEPLTLAATGFAPGERVEIVLHSTPVLLATVDADGDGAIRTVVTIPADTTPGAHRLVLTGTVSGPVAANLTVAARPDPDLVSTGAGSTMLLGVAALAALLGCLMFALARRRAERPRPARR